MLLLTLSQARSCPRGGGESRAGGTWAAGARPHKRKKEAQDGVWCGTHTTARTQREIAHRHLLGMREGEKNKQCCCLVQGRAVHSEGPQRVQRQCAVQGWAPARAPALAPDAAAHRTPPAAAAAHAGKRLTTLTMQCDLYRQASFSFLLISPLHFLQNRSDEENNLFARPHGKPAHVRAIAAYSKPGLSRVCDPARATYRGRVYPHWTPSRHAGYRARGPGRSAAERGCRRYRHCRRSARRLGARARDCGTRTRGAGPF